MTDDRSPSDPAPNPSSAPLDSTRGGSSGGTPFSERARVDAAPAARRLDALPVLYIVGFVILSAALIYLWKHPSLPPNAAVEVARVDTLRQQIEALTARVTELQARPAPTAPDLGPLTARLTELERRPPPAAAPAPNLAPLEGRIVALEARPVASAIDLRPLDARLDALEKQKPADLAPFDARLAALEKQKPVDVAPLEARVAGLEGRKPVDLAPLEARVAGVEARRPVDLAPLEARVAGLEGRKPVDLGPLTQQLDGLAKKEADDVASTQQALGRRLDQVEAAGKQTAAGLAAITERAQQAGRLQAMSAALAAGQRLGDVPGAPPALARFAHDAPPTEAGLRLSFDTAARAAHDASQPAIAGDRPFLDRLWGRAQQAVTVRQGDRVLVGDPIAGVIEHARQALDAGDLQGAVSTLDELAGPAKAAMAGWVGQAQSLLDARAAIGAMAARG